MLKVTPISFSRLWELAFYSLAECTGHAGLSSGRLLGGTESRLTGLFRMMAKRWFDIKRSRRGSVSVDVVLMMHNPVQGVDIYSKYLYIGR